MLCMQRTKGSTSSLFTSEMAAVIKFQIYLTRKANICFHLADNMNRNVFILLNKKLTKTEFSNAYFVPLCINSTLNCIFWYTAIPTRSFNSVISNFDYFFMSGLSPPGLRFPRHTSGDQMFCETFSKTKDASVAKILVSHVSLCKYFVPIHLLALYSSYSYQNDWKDLMHLHQPESAMRTEYVLHLHHLNLAFSKKNISLLYSWITSATQAKYKAGSR